MTERLVPVVLICFGVSCVVAAIAIIAGYPWAIGAFGVLALVAGVLLYDPNPMVPKTYPNNRGVR